MNLLNRGSWAGFYPPQAILRKKKFKKVVLEPPDCKPGSWRGAGKVLVDYENKEFWLTTRPRRAVPIRGYAVEIYRSTNGEDYSLVTTISREELKEHTGLNIASIEGQQLLKDPLTGKYYLYVAVDLQQPPCPGWDTLLLVADDPKGPWEPKGLVLRREYPYEVKEARDATIDIIDGLYFAVYKVNDGLRVNMALAVSSDGINWRKLGILGLDNGCQPHYFFLSGKIFAGTLGPILLGFETLYVTRGGGYTDTFVAYLLNYREKRLETLFKGRWEPQSPYERKDYPVHGYCDIVYDPFKERFLIFIEAVDPSSELGLNYEIDRVLLYETRLEE